MSLHVSYRHHFGRGTGLEVAFRSDALVTALFGPSGSGKTTTLSVINGSLPPDGGRVELAGRVLLDTQRRVSIAMRHRRIGMVFQEHRLFPHLTVEKNLRFGERSGRHRIELPGVVEALELEEMLTRLPHELSGGQRRRVALGRALLSDPELLVMDEPLGALDESLKHRVLGYLEKTVARWQVTTLFVTHSQAEVRRLAQWVVMLDQGRVVAEGPPDEVLGRKEALALRDESAGPVNVLHIEHVERSNGFHLGRLGEQFLHLPPSSEAVEAPLVVQCLPRDIILSSHDVSGVSARNHLRGVVREVVAVSQVVFVAVDVGQLLWCEVTPEAVRELELQPGRAVVCLIKTHSLSIVS